MPEIKALSMRVRVFRKTHHISQMEMSFRSGVSIEEISLIEREKTDPKLSTVQKLAAYMDITVSDLLEVESMKGTGERDGRTAWTGIRSAPAVRGNAKL